MMTRTLPAVALLLVLAAALALLVVRSSLAGGDTFTVTRPDDPQPDGCQPADCSFREAVAAANDGGGTVEMPAGTDVVLTMGYVTIAGDVDVTGGGRNVSSIAGNQNGRVLRIDGDAYISGLEVTGGFLGGGCGGGILNTGTAHLDDVLVDGNGSVGQGGGICNENTMTIENSTIDDNGARGDPAGGGVFNSGTMEITNSVVTNNTATNSSGGGDGAGIANTGELTVTYTLIDGNAGSSSACDDCSSGAGIDNDGTLTLEWSTVSDNEGDGGAGLQNGGDATVRRTTFSGNMAGAIRNSGDAEMLITNSTISGNQGAAYPDAGVGGITNSGSLSLQNVTIASNTAMQFGVGGVQNTTTGSVDYKATVFSNNGQNNCGTPGSHASNGYNVIDDDTCARVGTDQEVADAMLGPLADNGGPTRTHALLLGSPALDAASTPDCPTTDQRGVLRPQGAACDIGSYERE
jgi:hypothetical protein